MKKESIEEKYKLFNITEDNKSNYPISKEFANEYSIDCYKKCSILEEKEIRYYNSTASLEI